MAASDNIQPLPRPTVVGIGASAGGIQALSTFLDALPPNTGAAFVVTIHLDPHHKSELPNVLAAHTTLPVAVVDAPVSLEANHVYVVPPDRQLAITDNTISALPFEEPRGHRTPIDSFFRSLAAKRGDGFAVILTGGGSDGALSMKAVKEAGGIILVQDPAEAEHASMPSAAIATDVVDFVLPVRQIAERLAELISSKNQFATAQKSDMEENLRRILAHLRVRTGHDFSHYKRSTVMRRLMRRMQVTRKDNFESYFGYLRDSAEEAQALLADLLISVTTFFRDPKAYEALALKVIPNLFKGGAQNPVRVWVAGCATGEEAYSIAILLLEEGAKHDVRPDIQLFGSDMDARALNIAREGRYPASIEADVGQERLKRFFITDGQYYRVKRELRETVLFANHSLLKDPPFSRLNLVSCRNLLIYLDRDLQQQVLATLHYGLMPDGYLFLGASESSEHPESLFRVVDREARLYQSTGGIARGLPVLPRITNVPLERLGAPAVASQANLRTVSTNHREALEGLAPPSALVDQTGRVLHLSEQAGRYLQPSGGAFTSNIGDLVRQELRFELHTALHRAFERGQSSLSPAIAVRFNGSAVPVYLQVRPQLQENEKEIKRALVFFIEGEPNSAGSSPAILEESDETVKQLRQELEIAQGKLRTMREESGAATEELRAANEELQSINEEYRSTAEELETSKEELQSINEELQTVNSELKLKLETVSRANSDLQNLMAAMDFGTLFLDPDLRIKRFTPRVSDLFSITPGDEGRPITDFTSRLDYDGLVTDARAVLAGLVPIEREVRSRKGGWYLVRFRPYRTLEDKIDGLVATFVDISERRQMEKALQSANEKLEKAGGKPSN
jgi:two-component system, chemotaxis family, CheB/CheR fusion protein